MAYDFAQRHAHLRTRQRAVHKVDVVYRRKGKTVPLPATPHELSAAEVIPFGVTLDVRRRDYIMDLAPLAAGLPPFGFPQQGDEIHEGELICQVQPMGDEPCFRYTTHRRDEVRVHTQVISEP
ncbi:MAG: hypothetical protein AB7U73_15350 [Pirellulales bacterium]